MYPELADTRADFPDGGARFAVVGCGPRPRAEGGAVLAAGFDLDSFVDERQRELQRLVDRDPAQPNSLQTMVASET